MAHDFKEFRNLIKNCLNATKEIDGVARKNIAARYARGVYQGLLHDIQRPVQR